MEHGRSRHEASEMLREQAKIARERALPDNVPQNVVFVP
jgi:hypothetical protein